MTYQQDVLRQFMTRMNLDAVILFDPKYRTWYSNFISSFGYLVCTTKGSLYLLDGRYFEAGCKQAQNCEVQQIPTNNRNGAMDQIKMFLAQHHCRKVGFNQAIITYDHWQLLRQTCSNLTPCRYDSLRAQKAPAEVEAIKTACQITDQAYHYVCSRIRIGMTEKQVAQLAIKGLYKHGADDKSFTPIVASGVRGSLPHATPSTKCVKKGELITLDFGCTVNNYCSDVTRTFAVGHVNPNLQKIFTVVAQAQQAGLQAVKSGVKASTIDQICRDFITKQGYGSFFTHSTGHGLGLDVHEFPRVSPFCHVVLQPGMVITVEPGIYIPGVGGVRIEDDVLVTEHGYELLSKAQRHQNWLPVEVAG